MWLSFLFSLLVNELDCFWGPKTFCWQKAKRPPCDLSDAELFTFGWRCRRSIRSDFYREGKTVGVNQSLANTKVCLWSHPLGPPFLSQKTSFTKRCHAAAPRAPLWFWPVFTPAERTQTGHAFFKLVCDGIRITTDCLFFLSLSVSYKNGLPADVTGSVGLAWDCGFCGVSLPLLSQPAARRHSEWNCCSFAEHERDPHRHSSVFSVWNSFDEEQCLLFLQISLPPLRVFIRYRSDEDYPKDVYQSLWVAVDLYWVKVERV